MYKTNYSRDRLVTVDLSSSPESRKSYMSFHNLCKYDTDTETDDEIYNAFNKTIASSSINSINSNDSYISLNNYLCILLITAVIVFFIFSVYYNLI